MSHFLKGNCKTVRVLASRRNASFRAKFKIPVPPRTERQYRRETKRVLERTLRCIRAHVSSTCAFLSWHVFYKRHNGMLLHLEHSSGELRVPFITRQRQISRRIRIYYIINLFNSFLILVHILPDRAPILQVNSFASIHLGRQIKMPVPIYIDSKTRGEKTAAAVTKFLSSAYFEYRK